jgi:uncharacterized membrane protein YhiD involved in acid resistance
MNDIDVLQFIAFKMLYAVICGAVVGYEPRSSYPENGGIYAV